MPRPLKQREIELGDAELEVLKTLWDGGPATVRDVLAQLHANGRRVAYTTVQTVLSRLEQKGIVRSDRSGTAFRYAAAVSRERVSRTRLRTLLSQLYDGAAGQLVLQLMKNERLTADEIAQVQRLIDELDTRGGPKA